MTFSNRHAVLLVGALGVLVGCGSDPQVPSAATATASTTISAAVAATVAAVPAVRVTDAKGKGIKNILVRWRIASGFMPNPSTG